MENLQELIAMTRAYEEPVGDLVDIDIARLPGQGVDHPIFLQLIEALRPQLIVEFGSSYDKTALGIAQLCERSGLSSHIICVDTWLGSADDWLQARIDKLQMRNGRPHYYHDFIQNVSRSRFRDRIIPFCNTTAIAFEYLSRRNIRPDLICIDASQGERQAVADLHYAWSLLGRGGVILGNEYHRDRTASVGVLRVVDDFVNRHFLGLSTHSGRYTIWKNLTWIEIDRDYLESGVAAGSNIDESQFSRYRSRVCLAAVVRNEEATVANMIKSAVPLASNVAIVDNGSTDSTLEVLERTCRDHGLSLKLGHSRKERFDELRDDMLANVPRQVDWVLVLDADERLSGRDYRKFDDLFSSDVDVWFLPRLRLIDDLGPSLNIYKDSYPDFQCRLFKRNCGAFYVNPVHEVLAGYRTHRLAPCYSSANEEGGPHIFHLKHLLRDSRDFALTKQRYQELMRMEPLLGAAAAKEKFYPHQTPTPRPNP